MAAQQEPAVSTPPPTGEPLLTQLREVLLPTATMTLDGNGRAFRNPSTFTHALRCARIYRAGFV